MGYPVFQNKEKQEHVRYQIQALYEKYSFVVYRKCKAFLRNDSLAEDAVQEVFLRLSRSISRVPQDDKCFSYVYRMAVNVCIDMIHERKIVHEDFFDAAAAALVEKNMLVQKDYRSDLNELLQRQSHEIQEVIYLHFFEGLTYDEMTEILPFSRRTIIRKIENFLQKAKLFFDVT